MIRLDVSSSKFCKISEEMVNGAMVVYITYDYGATLGVAMLIILGSHIVGIKVHF